MLKKVLIAIQIALLIMPITMVNANEIEYEKNENEKEENKSEIIEEIEYEYLNGETWEKKKETIKFVIDEKENKHIIYEINGHIIDGTNLEYEENSKIKDVLEIGFPTKTKEELELKQDLEAYLATKFALIWNLNNYNKDELYLKIRDVKEENETSEKIEEKIEGDLQNQDEEDVKEEFDIKPVIDASYKILNVLEESKIPQIDNDDEKNEEKEPENNEEELPKEEENNQEEIVEQVPDIDLEVQSKNVINSNEEMEYSIKIKNNGNTNLEDFCLINNIDFNKSKLRKLYTGTFNKEIKYNVLYKTNKNFEYVLLEEELSSTINNMIDFDKISLNENEKVEEIKFEFKNVPIEFESLENIKIITKINNLKNNESVQNYTILEGKFNGIKLSTEKENYANVYNIEEKKKLPKTGY